jgi:peptidoglycan/LPS O-acetylase OafA/YrhL
MGGLLSLGIVSYSFYLIHQPIISLVPNIYYYLNISPHPLIMFATCVFMVTPLFWCSRLARKLVELPSINMGYRLLAMREESFVGSAIATPANPSLLGQPIPARAVAYNPETDTKAAPTLRILRRVTGRW